MAQLRPAQEEDVQALLRSGLRAIIANAPGTGKTATTISAISRTRLTRTPALIVAPASVTINWSREFAMWAPDLRVRVLDGPDEAPTDLRQLQRGVQHLAQRFEKPSARRGHGELPVSDGR